jgi:hypothetical protein
MRSRDTYRDRSYGRWPDVIITSRKRENVHTDRWGTTCEQYHTKGIGKETKGQELKYGDKKYVEYEMCVYTGNNNCGHRNGGKRFEENVESLPGKHTVDSVQRQLY